MKDLRFQELSGFQEILNSLQAQKDPGALGLVRSLRLPLALALQNELNVPVLFVSGQMNRINVLQEELTYWREKGEGILFHEPAPLFYENVRWDDATRAARIAVLEKLSHYWLPGQKPAGKDCFILSSIKALMTRTLPRREFILARKKLVRENEYDMETLLRHIVHLGYEYHEIVTSTGQFSHRGGILDIWLANQAHPMRLEFFGDEIDSMRIFDEVTQRSIENIESCVLVPAAEFLLPMNEEIDGEITRTERDISVLHPTAGSLISYLPKGTLIFLDDQDILITVSEEIERDAIELRHQMQDTDTISKHFPTPYFSWSELYDEMLSFTPVNMSFSGSSTRRLFQENIQPAPRFGGNMDDLFDFAKDEIGNGNDVSVISKQVDRLETVWSDKAQFIGDKPGKIIFEKQHLSSGWKLRYPDGHVHTFVTDEEIFGWQPAIRKRRRKAKQDITVFDFGVYQPGDHVVHFEYGIARYRGLVVRSLEGVDKEYLCLEFDNNDELYVPVHQADRISLYIGPDARPPKLSTLGTQTWESRKNRVREAVQNVAADLLALYSKRQDVEGHPFRVDSDWQRELEASFPYEETDDQLQAIEDVKHDMERAKPMDRLLCGDVGYGKTEVAVRAAFKAAMDGKQVAMLVPTTVLAQQHFDTFRRRLAPFPVKVEMLSRFRTQAEQEEILLSLETGEVDIIIGTHRLLQKDVRFKDLGLLIIDEEQRFGVMHKEFFKKMRTRIDVLTLTATPIPRTLYMALSGIRDISMISTAPTDRLPVTTHVGGFDSDLVRRAILREMDRGGQIFFVHNRVQSIETMAERLRGIVPEARIAVAHGQMHEKRLAKVMQQFTSHQVDVLLSTSIIESGLDIPNANTLIVDRGDTFGLAQLYQLRGRVGRGTQRAYAYFFFNSKRKPTLQGLERLEVIAENSQLGSGYSIAMRDLEMRGAGDLLGVQQHGHIASVGFYLYTRLLTEAVKALKKDADFLTTQLEKTIKEPEMRPIVNVDLPIPTSIPHSYVPNGATRLDLYRKLARITLPDEFVEMRAEFEDRFGKVPVEVDNLLWQTRIKLKAEKAGLYSIAVEAGKTVLRYPPLPKDMKRRVLTSLGQEWRNGKNEYYPNFTTSDENWRVKLERALSILAEKR